MRVLAKAALIVVTLIMTAASSAGDLTPYLQWYFDTLTGAKQESASYERIARETGHAPSQILFVSDVVAELDAARGAGMNTALCVRPGNKPQPEHDHRVVESFEQLVAA